MKILGRRRETSGDVGSRLVGLRPTQPQNFVFGATGLGQLDQAIDQLWTVVGVEVDACDLALLERLVGIKSVLDLRGVSRQNLRPAQFGLRSTLLQPVYLVAHFAGGAPASLVERGIERLQ